VGRISITLSNLRSFSKDQGLLQGLKIDSRNGTITLFFVFQDFVAIISISPSPIHSARQLASMTGSEPLLQNEMLRVELAQSRQAIRRAKQSIHEFHIKTKILQDRINGERVVKLFDLLPFVNIFCLL
jgi:hypothetical protein